MQVKWLTCASVSFVTSAMAAMLMVPGFIPNEGAEVIDREAMMEVNGMSHEEVTEYWKNPPTRKVHGFDRYKYAYEGGVALAYLTAVLIYFIIIFPATAIVSFLHVRVERDA